MQLQKINAYIQNKKLLFGENYFKWFVFTFFFFFVYISYYKIFIYVIVINSFKFTPRNYMY